MTEQDRTPRPAPTVPDPPAAPAVPRPIYVPVQGAAGGRPWVAIVTAAGSGLVAVAALVVAIVVAGRRVPAPPAPPAARTTAPPVNTTAPPSPALRPTPRPTVSIAGNFGASPPFNFLSPPAPPGPGPGWWRGRVGRRLHHFADKLDLTDDQKKQLRKLADAANQRLDDLDAEVKEARRKLRRLLDDGQTTQKQLEQAIDTLAKSWLERRKLRILTPFKLRSLLTPAQRKKLEQLFGGQINFNYDFNFHGPDDVFDWIGRNFVPHGKRRQWRRMRRMMRKMQRWNR